MFKYKFEVYAGRAFSYITFKTQAQANEFEASCKAQGIVFELVQRP